ncbi:MAG: ABC transporter ATP-binding protein [Eubacterium sp.]
MRHIFSNLKKYWYLVLIIVALLMVQAYCDLSLPDYTSNIIDVGITNSGVEHVVPEYITEKSYKQIQTFLTEDENAEWESAYEYHNSDKIYELKNTDRDYWEKLDDKFQKQIAVVYMMSSQKNSDMKDMDMTNMTPDSMTPEQQKKMMEALDKLGVDAASPTLMQDIRQAFEKKMSTLGDSMIASFGKTFAKQEYESCGININQMQSDYMWLTGGKMIAMTLLMALASILVGLLASRVSAGVGRDLRQKVFTKVISFSNAELDRFSTASLITRSTNDVQQIQMVTVMLLRMVLYAPILAIGGIVNVINYDSGMEWIIILAIAVVICIIVVLMVVAMPKFNIMQKLVDRVNLVSREILTGLPVIRAFSREKKEEERFEDANGTLTKVMLFTNRAMSFMMPALMIVMNGVSVLIVWVAANKIDEGVLEVGSMTAFITYSMMIIMGFLMLTIVSIMLPRAAVAANRINEVISTEIVIEDKENAITAKAEKGIIRFDHVDFKYPDGEENVLQDIDFVAGPGETTAIIGSTGSGKSTLAKLIPRFFDITDGSITLDGVDIREISIETLRSQIGYVPQQGVLFSGDIKSNIAYGAPSSKMKDIMEAAEIAQATEFIENKSEKYDSPIAQGGTNVSGGQKQRLSIARAIARNPKIYIFDDSFSALDFKTDTQLRKALKPKTKDATVLIVAQRVSTILHADQILVLDEGKLVGKGTHKELVNSCETYRQIAQSQLSEAEFTASIEGKED